MHSVHVPGKGSFQWNRAPMGLLGSLPSFVRMMEFLMTNLQDITYQEDLLIHTRTQKEQREQLQRVFNRLRANNQQTVECKEMLRRCRTWDSCSQRRESCQGRIRLRP